MTQEYDELVKRLRGEYRIPIKDGLGPVGGEEPNNPNEFVRKFETSPIQHEAASAITRLNADLASALEALNGTLIYEKMRANLQGFAGCTCINHSRETDRAYESGKCPHQIAAAELAKHKKEG